MKTRIMIDKVIVYTHSVFSSCNKDINYNPNISYNPNCDENELLCRLRNGLPTGRGEFVYGEGKKRCKYNKYKRKYNLLWEVQVHNNKHK